MNEELTRMRGRLAEYKQRFTELDLSAGSDITAARNLLDAYEPDVMRIKTAEAKVVVERLHTTVEEMKRLNVQIVELKEALK